MLIRLNSTGPARLPKLLPDETLYSLMARIHWLNDYENARDCCAMLLGDGDQLRVADSRFDPTRFNSATRGFYGDVTLLLARTSLSGFFGRLGTHPGVEVPRRLRPEDTDALAASDGLATLSNGRAHIWRSCPSCMQRDRDTYGVAYWHRRHQLPSVVICNEHQTPLLEATLLYRDRQQEFILPGRLPGKMDVRLAYDAGAQLPAAASLGRLAEQILLDDAMDASPESVRGALVDGLAEAGVVSRVGRIDKKAFIAGWMDHYGDVGRLPEFTPPLSARNVSNLMDALSQQGWLLPATTTVMLADWLFGSWPLFREHCTWRKALCSTAGATGGHRSKNSASAREDASKNHRGACISFLKSHPDATRKDFWVACPRSCRWLHTHDEKWLQRQLPAAHGRNRIQPELF